MGTTSDTLDELAANVRELVAQGRRKEQARWRQDAEPEFDAMRAGAVVLVLVVLVWAWRRGRTIDTLTEPETLP